jgi:hypothetical protein
VGLCARFRRFSLGQVQRLFAAYRASYSDIYGHSLARSSCSGNPSDTSRHRSTGLPLPGSREVPATPHITGGMSHGVVERLTAKRNGRYLSDLWRARALGSSKHSVRPIPAFGDAFTADHCSHCGRGVA